MATTMTNEPKYIIPRNIMDGVLHSDNWVLVKLDPTIATLNEINPQRGTVDLCAIPRIFLQYLPTDTAILCSFDTDDDMCEYLAMNTNNSDYCGQHK
jgi:hypothetical protein